VTQAPDVSRAPPATILFQGRRIPLGREGLTIGRLPDNDVQIADDSVSRHHARIAPARAGYSIVDLESGNGTQLNGERFRGESRSLANGDTVVVGGEALRFLAGEETRVGSPGMTLLPTRRIQFSGDRLRIGRDPSNDVVLDDPNVSRLHAEVLRKDGRLELHDLGSRNGTRLDGELTRRASLETGSEIGVGPYRLIFDGTDFVARSERGALRLDAEGVGQQVKDKRILEPTSLSIAPGELIGIIGESGCGKSTLMKALAGVKPPSEGRITVNGEPLASRLTDIGYLPQDEVVHGKLTVYEALSYAARLRLPHDTSREELRQTLDRVLDELELGPHAHTLIEALSGGQRKRVGLAAELLSRPSLLFLDEPTTGLDPGLETRMMALLRDLADHSRAVVVVTHATKSLDMCARIIVMGRGGRLCYQGPADEAPAFFGAETHDEIYAELGKRAPEEWQRKLAEEGRAQPVVPEEPPEEADRKPARTRRGRLVTQAQVLTRRYVRLLMRDRRNMLILLLQVPVLALAIAGLFKEQAFARGTEAGEAVKLLFLMTITVIWLGSIDAAREVIKEKSVYVREAAVGVRTSAYLLSKASVLFTLAALQTLVLAAIVLLFQPLRASTDTYLIVVGLMLVTAFAAVGMGLLMSSAVRSQDQATSFIPLLLIPQLFFGGSLVPLATMSDALATVSKLVLAQWAYAGLGSAVDLDAKIAASPAYAKVSKFGDDYFAIPTGEVFGILGIFLVVSFAGVALLLRRNRP
jgi:ABC-type multidrug transport system ATPase subunit/pSer/pThr/pTyr-binding forkhead associated (FHA) protein/ABC-type multidrug transport system permease subunit